MATREEFSAALAQWRDAPFFGSFMKTLASRRDAVVAQCLAATTQEEAEVFRLEARALDWMVRQFEINLPYTGNRR